MVDGSIAHVDVEGVRSVVSLPPHAISYRQTGHAVMIRRRSSWLTTILTSFPVGVLPTNTPGVRPAARRRLSDRVMPRVLNVHLVQSTFSSSVQRMWMEINHSVGICDSTSNGKLQ